MFGSGPPTGGPSSTHPTRRSRAAFRKIRAAGLLKEATTPVRQGQRFPARSSRAARICVRRTIAAATGRPRATPKTSTRRQAIWGSDASFGGRGEPVTQLLGEASYASVTKAMARSACGGRRSFDGERACIRPTATEAQHPLHHGRRYRLDAAEYLPPRPDGR